MSTNNALTVNIGAVNRASAAIDAVVQKLGEIKGEAKAVTAEFARISGIEGAVRKLGELKSNTKVVAGALARLSAATGVTRVAKAVQSFGGSTLRVGATAVNRLATSVRHLGGMAAGAGLRMVEALGPLSALTAALSLGGIAKMTTDWAKFSQSLGFDAARIGSSVGELHALEGSARLSGSSAEAAASGLRTLQDTMTDTVGGRNMEALVYFRQLGVAFDDGRGHALRATAVLPKLADAISRIKDPSLQARVATVFFGGAAESMLPWLRRGSAGIAEYAEMARHYGVQTEASADKAGVFRLAQTRLSLAFEGLGHSISEKVSPPLAKMMTFLAELVNKWRKPISDTLGGWAKAAGEWIEHMDWPAVIKNIETLAGRFKELMEGITSYKPPAWLRWVIRQFSADEADDGHVPASNPQGVLPSKPLTPGEHTDRGRRIMGQLEGLGWTHADAAAMVTGMDRESNGLDENKPGDFDAITGLPTSRGLMQLHLERQDQFNAWSKGGGTTDGRDLEHASVDDQIRFLDYDLTRGPHKSVGAAMRAARTPAEKMKVYDEQYEIPADKAGALAHDLPRLLNWSALDPIPPGQAAKTAGAAAPPNPAPRDKPTGANAPADPAATGQPANPSGGSDPLSPALRDKLMRTDATADATPPAGSVQVNVHIKGLPPGASATSTTTGAARGSVRIARAMP